MTSNQQLNRVPKETQGISNFKSLRYHALRSGLLLTVWFFLMAGVNLWNLNQLVEPMQELRDEVLSFNRLLMKLSESTSKSYRHYNHLFLRLSRQELGLISRLKSELGREQELARELLAEADRLPWDDFAWATEIKEDWQDYRKLYTKYLDIMTSTLKAVQVEGLSEQRVKELDATAYSDESRGLRSKILELESRLLEHVRKESHNSQALTRSAGNKSQLLLGLLWVLGVLISTILLWLTRKDLGHTVASVFQILNQSKEQFRSIFSQVTAVGGQVHSQAKDSAERLVQISQGANSLTEQVNHSAKFAQAMRQMAQKNREDVEQGARDLQTWQQQMREIREESLKVQNVVTVIDDIAFQINLLALNAAVEAARAGEEGRGFAVVAQAIRGLAQKSAEAAQEIHTLSSHTVQLVEQSDQAGSEVLQAFEHLRQEVVRLNDLNQEIATGAEEQSSGLNQMSQALEQISQAVRGNSERSQALSKMSDEVAQQIAQFELALQNYAFVFNLSSSSKVPEPQARVLPESQAHRHTANRPHLKETQVIQSPLEKEQSPEETTKEQENSLPERTRQSRGLFSETTEDEFWAEAIEKIEKRKKAS